MRPTAFARVRLCSWGGLSSGILAPWRSSETQASVASPGWDDSVSAAPGLHEHGSARHVTVVPGVRSGHALLTAEVIPESVDPVLELLMTSGVAKDTSEWLAACGS